MTLLRLLFVVGILAVCCSAALPKQSTALAIIDSKFRHENPLEIEAILFGSDNKHFSGETECHVDVDVMWTTSFSAPVSSHPLVADIRSDGQKELIYSTTSNHVEAIEGLDGSKEPGWPVSIPATSFTYTPMLYDYDEDGVQDILITSEQSEVIFVNDAGIPLDEAVLACPPLKIKKKTFHGYNLLATRGFSFLLHQNFDLPSWGKNFNSRLLMGIEENNEQENANNNNNHRTPKNPTFAGVEGWLTPDGVESLELFLPTESSSQKYLEMLRTGFNPLASMQYIKDSEGLFTELDDSIFLYPRISGPPIIVDLEMDGNDELIVPFQFFGDDPFHANIQIEASIRERNPSVSGLVAFDLQTKRIKYIRPLEITSDPSAIRTTIRSSPTVIDINRDGKYDVIVATNTGHIHALNHRLEPIPGFPLAMDSIQGRPVVEDINGDGSLELIVTDSKGNVACFSLDSKTLIWDAKISGVVTGSPSFGDVDGDGKLDIVLATSAGHLWVLNGKDGTNLNHFPSRLTGNFMGSPLILQMADGDKHMSIIVHSLDGHVYIINGKTGCTETIDVGHKGSQMVIADDLTNNNKLDLIVSSGDSVYALSTDVPYSPQRVWTLPDHGLNVHTSLHWQAIYFDLDHSHSLEISGSSFAVSFMIVDSRSSSAQRTYNVRIYLNRQKVLHEATFFQPGLHTVVLDSPPERLSSLLHISMTNQHLQYYHDAVSVDFNTKFYRSLKWIVVAPLVFATMIVLFMKA